MTKLLILQERIPDYRHALFNELAKKFELTVACVEPNKSDVLNYQLIKLNRIVLLNTFFFVNPRNLDAEKNDVVIVMFNLRWLNYISLCFKNYRTPILFWGHAKRVGKYSQFFRKIFFQLSSGMIVYAESEAAYLKSLKWQEDKIFVAPNAVPLADRKYYSKNTRNTKKDKFIFVGRLESRKKVDQIIISFSRFKELPSYNNEKLVIIGSGTQLNQLTELTEALRLTESIVFFNDNCSEETISALFRSSIAYVSPGATGLGINHAAGYDTPSIISNDAGNGPEVDSYLNAGACYLTNGTIEDLTLAMRELADTNKGIRRKLQAECRKVYTKETFPGLVAKLEDIVQRSMKCYA